MEVRSPIAKPDEQYPLLEGDSAGDSLPTRTSKHPSGWGVQCSRKKIGCSRWPEIVSACWITTILCGVSFMVIYGLGMGACRRHQFIFLKYNDSRPASNVFYHHIVPRGEQVPFLRYSEYLAFMARQHPYLRFSVFFLIDDSFIAYGPIQNRFMSKMIPNYPSALNSLKSGDNYKEALVEFEKRFQNVNVTIMPLSKYMAGTPLRYKWRYIATSYLPFYARVFSVWENGGIGMDLADSNAMDDSPATRKKVAILRQHNDGIDLKAYVNTLNKLDEEDDTAIFTLVFSLFNRILNDTSSLFNNTLSISPQTDVLVQSHRTKRSVADDSESKFSVPSAAARPVSDKSNLSIPLHMITPPGPDVNVFNVSSNMTDSNNTNTKLIMFDFQIVSDSIGPPYLTQPSTPMKKAKEVRHSLSHLLAMDCEGTFIAASTKLHPLIGHLILSGCLRLSPRLVIQDALLSQCSSLIREDVYCNNIYIL